MQTSNLYSDFFLAAAIDKLWEERKLPASSKPTLTFIVVGKRFVSYSSLDLSLTNHCHPVITSHSSPLHLTGANNSNFLSCSVLQPLYFSPSDVDKSGNIVAGFATNEGQLANPLVPDFYLQSHGAIQGSKNVLPTLFWYHTNHLKASRSGHYIILHDENFGGNFAKSVLSTLCILILMCGAY